MCWVKNKPYQLRVLQSNSVKCIGELLLFVVLFHCVQRKVQEYVYCFMIKGCAINCEGSKIERSTRYCVYAVNSQ